MLNLFIAVIVNTMQAVYEAEFKQDQVAIEEAVRTESAQTSEELRALREEILALKKMMAAQHK